MSPKLQPFQRQAQQPTRLVPGVASPQNNLMLLVDEKLGCHFSERRLQIP
jgi:hypothetical protein